MAAGRVIDKRAFFDQIGYKPHKGQQEYHMSPARFRIPVCGRRYGKSLMAGRDREPSLFVPNTRAWIVGPTYDLGEKEFRVIWDDLIVKQAMGRDKRIRKSYNKKQGDMFIQFPWNTRLEVRSADHPDMLVGESLDWVIMSESAKHKKETWERFIRPALSDRRGSADFPTTPEGYNWLHELWQLGMNPEFKDYSAWQNPSWDNYVIYPGGREDPEIQLLESTTGRAWFKQEIGADFSAFVGKIYEDWLESTHVKPVKFNPLWPNYIAFDWGFTNPLAAIEFQVDPWDRVYVWREHYRSFMRLEDHLRVMAAREQPPGYRIDLCFGDAADPEATQTVSVKFAPCISLPAAKENWRQGVELVGRKLKSFQVGEEDEYGTPAYEPWLYVDHSCTNTIKEFNNYRSKEPIKGQNVPEMGRKIDDHAMDALRYGLMHVFELGANTHLSDVYPTHERESVGSELLSNSGLTSEALVSGIFTRNVSF